MRSECMSARDERGLCMGLQSRCCSARLLDSRLADRPRRVTRSPGFPATTEEHRERAQNQLIRLARRKELLVRYMPREEDVRREFVLGPTSVAR
jgi:hypothetical protein